MSYRIWHVPWTEVRYGTEHEENDTEWNWKWANALLDGNLDLWEKIIADTPDDEAERIDQGMAVVDDMLIALDMLGWKVVSKDDPETFKYPIGRDDDFCPDWCR